MAIKKLLQKIHHQLFKNQSVELISSSNETDNIIQDKEVIFKKNPAIDLPELSRLIDSVISKRQGDKRKYSFLQKKKTPYKIKWIDYENPELSLHLMDRAIKQSTHQFLKIYFHISKCLACNAKKTLQLKITQREQI